MHIVDREKIKQIPWVGNIIEYDQQLFELGKGEKEFFVPNPNVAVDLDQIIKKVPNTNRCVVWYYNQQWIAKRFNSKWRPEYGYYDILIPDGSLKFNFLWIENLDLNLEYENNPFRNYRPTLDESFYELVWYIDPRFVPTDEKIWAVKCKNQNQNCLGIKDMGYITPKVKIEINPRYNHLLLDVESLYPPYYLLDHEFVHGLDREYFSIQDDEIPEWAVKFTPIHGEPESVIYSDDVVISPKIVFNPELPEMQYDTEIAMPFWELEETHYYMLDKKHCSKGEQPWAFKVDFCKQPKKSKIMGEVSPILKIELNSDLPKLDYEVDYELQWWDFRYEHIWMLDEKHCEEAVEDIWAFKVRVTKEIEGVKIVDSVSPSFTVTYNPALPKLEYDLDYTIPYYDLGYDHLWLLDERHTENLEEKIWAIKIQTSRKSLGTKIVGDVSPKLFYEFNKELKGYSYDIPEIFIPYHDLSYRHVWMLNKSFSGDFDIWAVKISCVKKTKEEKLVGDIDPVQILTLNTDLENLKINLNYKIPYYDRMYEHVWYLDKEYTNGEKIWAAKLRSSNKVVGEKEVGSIIPDINSNLDVIFISYHQSNAEENWARVKEKAPWAKRVDGVEGIFEAHKAAAKLSTTDMFYVVDGDAWLVDDWKFDYNPTIFDRDCVYVWNSLNPVNGLRYGHGGVKLFSKSELSRKKKWTTLDMTTGSMSKLKFIDKVSNISTFNTSEFEAWRTAFRECVKLWRINKIRDLDAWATKGTDKEFGSYCIDGAQCGIEYAKDNSDNPEKLLKINDYKWLYKKFKNFYKNQT